jgi:hypothetical protein
MLDMHLMQGSRISLDFILGKSLKKIKCDECIDYA